MQLSLVELWSVMGPLAKVVVLLLLIMSLACLATSVDRWLAIRAAPDRLTVLEPKWRTILSGNLSADDRREAYDRAVRSAALEMGTDLRRGITLIATVGATAPFVGLVGTVLGIVSAFQQLTVSEETGVGQVSAGIAEALVTTAIGIAVAIPAVWLFNYLTQRIARVLSDLEQRAQDLAVATLREGR